MAGEVSLDALPYFDQGYEEPGVREEVSGLRKLRFENYNARFPNRPLVSWKRRLGATGRLETI